MRTRMYVYMLWSTRVPIHRALISNTICIFIIYKQLLEISLRWIKTRMDHSIHIIEERHLKTTNTFFLPPHSLSCVEIYIGVKIHKARKEKREVHNF